ncbi:MAG: CRISPR-associated endonuclease Cas2 [Defluviitaleaceae bacterium]|nr:CRISPR-associated endonuclease Cas2 [Defluviitaleaceae bacterium]MCL2275806.1 CRISPR-associated endonuclease Cas2 [Defluviitaleaceae bacterium]
MRILVFFDLPVKTKPERRVATQFRNFLLKDGYHMLQFSIYARTCNGTDAVEKHKTRLYNSLPDNGSIRMLVITEKQYQSIEILVGNLKEETDTSFAYEQLTLL